jgi:hypothetical protein
VISCVKCSSKMYFIPREKSTPLEVKHLCKKRKYSLPPSSFSFLFHTFSSFRKAKFFSMDFKRGSFRAFRFSKMSHNCVSFAKKLHLQNVQYIYFSSL